MPREKTRRSALRRQTRRAAQADPHPVEPLRRQVCERVRQARKQRDWTLEQLASLSGVSRSMLSQIERGAASPTLGVVFRIAQAFGMSLSDLVDAPQPIQRIDAIRASESTYLFRDDEDCRIRTLSPLHLEKDVEFYELTLKPLRALQSAPHFAGTREFLTMVQGRVRLTSDRESCELGPGDSAHYPADVSHRIENLTETPAIAFLVDIYAAQRPRDHGRARALASAERKGD